MKSSLSNSDSPVEITVNGEPRGIPAECTVQNLLDLLGMEGRRVAVARNRDIVPRSEYAAEEIRGGDHVEILEAVGGG